MSCLVSLLPTIIISLQLKSALKAVEGDTAVVIANGLRQGETILDIVRGKTLGTFITRNGHIELADTSDVLADNGTSS